jgi:hypothetical protein
LGQILLAENRIYILLLISTFDKISRLLANNSVFFQTLPVLTQVIDSYTVLLIHLYPDALISFNLLFEQFMSRIQDGLRIWTPVCAAQLHIMQIPLCL